MRRNSHKSSPVERIPLSMNYWIHQQREGQSGNSIYEIQPNDDNFLKSLKNNLISNPWAADVQLEFLTAFCSGLSTQNQKSMAIKKFNFFLYFLFIKLV